MKIQDKHLKLKDGQRAFFGDNDECSIWRDGSEFRVSCTLSGVEPTESYHLTTRYYVDNIAFTCDWQPSVLDKDLTAPLGGPSTGDRYIVGTSASGTWNGHDDDITEWIGSEWTYITPDEGYATWVEDEDRFYTYNGANWVLMETYFSHSILQDLDADDHLQYVRADGGVGDSRGFTATVSGIDPTEDYHLTTKKYVDERTIEREVGRTTLALNDSSKSVLFGTVFSDTNYSLSIVMRNEVDASPSIYPMIVTSTTVSGFSVLFSGDMDSNSYYLDWFAAHDE